MNTIKIIGCFAALIVMVALVTPVLADPYFGLIQAGSSYDLTQGTVTSDANDMFIGSDAGVPMSLNYEIKIMPYSTPTGQIPARGSASAFYRVHTMEGRAGSNTVSQEITSSSTTSVNGIIYGFSKKFSWQSGPHAV